MLSLLKLQLTRNEESRILLKITLLLYTRIKINMSIKHISMSTYFTEMIVYILFYFKP